MATAQAEMRQAGYELLDQLGHGGFGLVYSGKPLNNTTGDLNQEVAIKLTKCSDINLWTTLPNDTVRIPLETAALLVLISVTSVVDFLGYGKMSLGNDDVFSLVMKKPTGCISFASYLRRQTPLSETMAFFFLKQLMSMVEAIHRCGWVHGDLKPSNLLICAQDQLKAIDCGLAMEVVNDKCITTAGGTLLWNIYLPSDLTERATWSSLQSGLWVSSIITRSLENDHSRLFRNTQSRPLRWHRNISCGAKFMLQRLLDPDPNSRLVIQDLERLILTQPPQ